MSYYLFSVKDNPRFKLKSRPIVVDVLKNAYDINNPSERKDIKVSELKVGDLADTIELEYPVRWLHSNGKFIVHRSAQIDIKKSDPRKVANPFRDVEVGDLISFEYHGYNVIQIRGNGDVKMVEGSFTDSPIEIFKKRGNDYIRVAYRKHGVWFE